VSTTPKSSRAYGFSDRSGFRYDLKDLVPQYINRKPSGLLVGRDEVDIDQEQLQLGEVDASDPQSLLTPRPDQNLAESRALSSWKPVGTNGLSMSGIVGRVTVSTE
jgi:hypothetical protein